MKIKGINRNITPDELPEGFCLNNKNVVYSQYLNAIVNENGFLVHQKKLTDTNSKYGLIRINVGGIFYVLKPIGCRQLDNNALLVWSCGFKEQYVNDTFLEVGIAEIGIVTKEGEYISYIRDTNNELGFNPNNPITGEFDYNYKKELITAFTDYNTPPKLINLTYYKNNPSLFQINDCLMFPDKSDVNCNITVNNFGGVLISGSYFFIFKYKKKDGSDTNYGSTKNPIIIYKDEFNTAAITSSQGSAPNTKTSKSIALSISNVNTTFDFLTLSVIKCINNQFLGEEVIDLPIAGNTLNYLYTGTELATSVPVSELITPRAVYNKLGKFTTVSKRLYAMKAEQFDFDYQPFANNIRLNWCSKLKNPYYNGLDSPKNQTARFTEKSFQHREVYSFYIHLLLDGGVLSRGFHIPGLVPSNPQRALSTIAQTDGVIGKVFQVEDTCTVTGTNAFGEFYGKCGVWENDNEYYPNTESFNILDVDVNGDSFIIGDLKNQKVRHHKMPSIKFMKQAVYSTETNYGRSVLDCLGIEFFNIKIPKELLGKVEGYVISYGERTGTNNIVLGQSLLVNSCYSQGTTGLSFGSNGINCKNFQYNNTQSNTNVSNLCRFYDSSLLKNRINLADCFLTQELDIVTRPGIVADVRNGSGSLNNLQTYAITCVDSISTDTPSIPLNSNTYRKVQFSAYVNSQTIASINYNAALYEIDNRYLEDALVLKLNRDLTIINNNARWDTGTDSLNNKNLAYNLSTLNITNYNPYLNFYTQKLVSTGAITPLNEFFGTTIKTYSGDTYITYNTFATLGWGASQSTVGTGLYDEFKGIRTSYIYLCESTLPLDLRNINDADVNQRYFPRYPHTFVNDLNNRWNVTCNFWDDSILKINNITPLIPNNPYINVNTKFDFRIARSSPLAKESLSNNWGIWLTNDYYEANRNKGELTNIQGYDRNLYIQTRQSSFYTTGNEQLNIDNASAFIGVGNIFEREPIEILPSEEGTVGTQNMFSCVLTKYGLVTIDRENGIIWLLNGSEATNISKGLQYWFRDNLNYSLERVEFQEDNPFSLFGFTTAYDFYNNRLIISKKFYNLTEYAKSIFNSEFSLPRLEYINGRFILSTTGNKEVINLDNETYFINKCFTYSFSFVTQEWISEHDYTPDFLINTRNLLLSFKNGFLYNNNNVNNKAIYYNSSIIDIDAEEPETAIPYNSYVIPVFNFNIKESKLFNSISWLAKVFANGLYQQQKTFSGILTWNDYQTSGETGLILFDFDNYFDANTRNIKDQWFFNNLRDLLKEDYFSTETQPFILNYSLNEDLSPIDTNKPFENKRPLIDKYLAVKLLYNNEINGILQNEIRIEEITVTGEAINR